MITNPYRNIPPKLLSGEASLPLFWFDMDDDNVWDDQGWAPLNGGLKENGTITTDASGPNGQTVAVITGENDLFGPDPFSTALPYDGESHLMSFSLWYYRTGGDDISELWTWKNNDTDRIFDVTLNTITDTLDVHFDDINDNSSNPIATNVGHTDNTWHHVCASWDGTTGRLYFDGEEVASDNLGRTGGTVNSNNRNWQLGGGTNTFKYTGKLAMAGFWDNAITADDVSYLYNNALGRQFSEFTFTSGVRAPLHYWNLDTSSWEDSVTANAWNAGLTENGTPTLAGGVGPEGQDVLSIDRGDWISDNQVWDGKTQIYDRDRISVSAWVYIDSYDTNGNMHVAWRNLSGDLVMQFHSNLSGGKYVLNATIFRSTGSCVIEDTNFELLTGAWHHIACTFDNRVGKLYADNSLIATTSVPNNGQFATGSMIFNIGNFVNDVASYNRQGDGYIAMVGIWDTALAAHEISHLYNAGAGLKYSELNLLPVGY